METLLTWVKTGSNDCGSAWGTTRRILLRFWAGARLAAVAIPVAMAPAVKLRRCSMLAPSRRRTTLEWTVRNDNRNCDTVVVTGRRCQNALARLRRDCPVTGGSRC